MQQLCKDFLDESEALFRLLDGRDENVYDRKTLFKDWTINEVICHLHAWNRAADMSLSAPEEFAQYREQVIAHIAGGRPLREFDTAVAAGLRGQKLLDTWRGFCVAMSERFATVDPKLRLQWVGPGMSARSSITARLMETWAHAQEVYDVLGVTRVDTDRIRNIVQLGVNTFGWTFSNRGLEVPPDPPYLRLTAPSGEIWEWNEPSDANRIEGQANEFCQVVTQVRNIADTGLKVTGDTATRWMAIAQCFAGGPVDPPAKGARHPQA